MVSRVLPPLMLMGSLLLLLLLSACLGEPQRQVTEGPTRAATDAEELNLTPIIGVLAQELSKSMDEAVSPHNYTSYIAASYVKFYESAGARIVPVMINQDDDYYAMIAASLNGMIFPGGSASITDKSGYGRAGELLYRLLQERDPPVPLLATCLGFEMMMYLAGNGSYPLTRCYASSKADPLDLYTGWEESRMLGEAPEDVLEILTTTNATSNFHKYCVLPETFYDLSIDQDYILVSTSEDFHGVEYVSTVEHRTLPFYGVQWHPEKNLFEWAFSSIPHTSQAVQAAQYIANFFVEQARHNNQSFPTPEKEQAALIYNYCPVYTATRYRSSFQQCYFFE
ncbi:Gamma-glutamyl hydrolase [Chionoecetes opilio]|uniref:folate gamma-glutamyl hydrolase n=1 Tax=Chionoecetes opilio TaxID=41210 RepID=A0A8J4Y2F7_CHIOP|nr:Gamma-glutamyl hydrolase [Chionoecetes opilio]